MKGEASDADIVEAKKDFLQDMNDLLVPSAATDCQEFASYALEFAWDTSQCLTFKGRPRKSWTKLMMDLVIHYKESLHLPCDACTAPSDDGEDADGSCNEKSVHQQVSSLPEPPLQPRTGLVLVAEEIQQLACDMTLLNDLAAWFKLCVGGSLQMPVQMQPLFQVFMRHVYESANDLPEGQKRDDHAALLALIGPLFEMFPPKIVHVLRLMNDAVKQGITVQNKLQMQHACN